MSLLCALFSWALFCPPCLNLHLNKNTKNVYIHTQSEPYCGDKNILCEYKNTGQFGFVK